jgi:predicted signal transduction protein with EAL and GGDEF domain
VGVAVFPDDGEDLGTLVDAADSALYAAKRGGRNAVRAHEPGMRGHPGRRRDVKVTADADIG